MLTTIHITVCDRVPTITDGEDVISHNSDYAAEFVFDEEWQSKVKTVYFVCEDGSYQAVVMSGNSCNVPMMAGEHRRIFVGVQAGSAEKPSVLKTTRPCCLKVKDSIADYLGQPIPDPTPDVYEQIIAMLNNLTTPTWDAVQNKPFESIGDGLSVENGVLSAKGGGGSPNAVQYVAQELTDEQKTQARENIEAPARALYAPVASDKGKYFFKSTVGYNELREAYNEGAAVYLAVGIPWTYIVPLLSVSNNTMIFAYFDTVQFYAIKYTVSSNSSISVTFDRVAGDNVVSQYQGTENAGKILGVGEDGNVIPQDKPTYTLPQATADALGGIKADAATAEDTQDVRIGADGKMKTKPYTLTDADKTAVAEEVVADGVAATLVDIPSGGGGTWEELIDTTIEAGEGITAISLNLPKSDIAKGYACQMEFTKSTGDAWAGNANMTPRINGALMGYFLFNDDLSKNSINYFAIGNFELLGNGYIDFVRHVYSLENNPSNVTRQLGANKFTANVTGKFEMSFAGKTYIGTAKIKVWGRYK